MAQSPYKIREKFKKSYEQAFERLNTEQRAAVQKTEGSVMVVAGPGTGKTQILAMRVAEILDKGHGVSPHNILCLTFTDAATVAMRKRLVEIIGPEAHKVHIYTFHGFTNQVIQENLGYFGNYRKLDALSDLEKVDVYEDILQSLPSSHLLRRVKSGNSYEAKRLANLFQLMKKENKTVDDMLKLIDDYVAELQTSEDYLYKRKYTNKKTGKVFEKGDLNENKFNTQKDKVELLRAGVNLFPKYISALDRIGRYDYQDMILWVNKAFKENDDILAQYQERYQYYLVDEFQDTNGSQMMLLELLINFMDIEPNVFVVGDDDQAIYKFQGANIGNISKFLDQYEPETVVLQNNYRSSQSILDSAMALINNNGERIIHDLRIKVEKNLIAQGKYKDLSALPVIASFDNVVHEQAYIADRLIQLHNSGVDLNTIAVIYRKHAQVDKLVSVLEKQNIPLNIKRRIDILKIPIVENLLKILYYIQSEYEKPNSEEQLLFEIMHFNFFNIQSRDIAKLSLHCRDYSNLKQFRDVMKDKKMLEENGIGSVNDIFHLDNILDKWTSDIANVTLQTVFQNVINEGNVLKAILRHPDKTWLLQVLSTLFDYIKEESNKNPDIKLKELLDTIDKMKLNELPMQVNKIIHSNKGVHFITAHSAKGLEFEHVIMIGCTKNIWDTNRSNFNSFFYPPLVNGDVESNEEDERRLFYVAMTRAEKELEICYSHQSEQGKELGASRFVDELLSDAIVETKHIEVGLNEINNYQMYTLFNQEKKMELIDGDLIDKVLRNFKLSVTGLNKYLKCQISYYFENILRVPTSRNRFMGFGRAIHHAYQVYFEQLDKGNRGSITDLIQHFSIGMRDTKSHFTKSEFQEFTEYGERILTLYFDEYLGRLIPAKSYAIEEKIDHAEYKGIPIKGVLDLVQINQDSVRVVDYKTGNFKRAVEKLRPPVSEEDKGGDYWRQIVFYKLLLDSDNRRNWNMSQGIIDFVEPQHNTKIFKQQQYAVKPEEIEKVGSQIKQTWEDIHAHKFNTLCDDENCYWCEFVRNDYVFSDELERDLLEEDVAGLIVEE